MNFKNYSNKGQEDDATKDLEEQIRVVANKLYESIELEKLEKSIEKFNKTLFHKGLAIILLRQQLEIMAYDVNYIDNSRALPVLGDLLLGSLLQAVNYILIEKEIDDCTRAKIKQYLTTISNVHYKTHNHALLIPENSLLSSLQVFANFLNDADTYFVDICMPREEAIGAAFDNIFGGLQKIRESVEALIIACNGAELKEASAQKLSIIEQQLLIVKPKLIEVELVLLYFCMRQQPGYTEVERMPSDEQLHYVLKIFVGPQKAKEIIPSVVDGLEKTLDISKDDKLHVILNTIHNKYRNANSSKFTNDFNFMPSLIIIRQFLLKVKSFVNSNIGSNDAVPAAFDSVVGGLPSIRDSLETLIQACDNQDSSKEAVQQLLAIKPQLLELEKSLPLFVMGTRSC